MKRKLWLVGICMASAIAIYIGSFFAVLAGAHFRKFDWVDRMGVGYRLHSETDEHGFVFSKDPWMRFYRPLYNQAAIYKKSRDPHKQVTLNGYGEIMFAVYYWGTWPDQGWKKAIDTSRRYSGWTYSEWFPDRYEWKQAGEIRYPLPN